jgi:YVTN family beta-propeller protein
LGCTADVGPIDRIDPPVDPAPALAVPQLGVFGARPEHTDPPPWPQPEGIPAISGGTLAMLGDGTEAWVSDPERDRGLLVDLDSQEVRSVAFAANAEPGRAIEDGAGRLHVVLRGAGEVAAIDPTTATVTATTPVCGMPRGIVYEAATDLLHVACRDGELVSLAPDGAEVRRVVLRPDLRDVVVVGDELWVSTFRDARVLRLDAEGALLQTMRLPVPGRLDRPGEAIAPSVAWRMVGTEEGVAIVHQRAVQRSGTATYGDPPGGAPLECSTSVVEPAVTFIHSDRTMDATAPFGGATLPVDVAVLGDAFAVPSAGHRDRGRVTMYSHRVASESTCVVGTEVEITPRGRAVAVAFDGAGELVVQLREPAALVRGSTVIPLGGEPVSNPGHELFHTAAGETQTGLDGAAIGFIACASCHPEGGDDAQSWPSADRRLRRTQSLEGGISGTEPFHWDGGMHSMRALSEAVFVGRMGGRELTSEELVSMLHWIDSIPRPQRAAIQDPEAVARGRELFADPSLGCLTCHNGPRLGSNLSVDVGTGLVAQVPSLVGVA